MFCFGAGCEVCVKPARKASPKSRKPVTTVNTILAPAADSATVTKPDVKAAMKAVSTSQVREQEEEDGALLDALVALEPILHPDELAKISDDLDAYKSPAERWRWRHGQRKR